MQIQEQTRNSAQASLWGQEGANNFPSRACETWQGMSSMDGLSWCRQALGRASEALQSLEWVRMPHTEQSLELMGPDPQNCLVVVRLWTSPTASPWMAGSWRAHPAESPSLQEQGRALPPIESCSLCGAEWRGFWSDWTFFPSQRICIFFPLKTKVRIFVWKWILRLWF